MRRSEEDLAKIPRFWQKIPRFWRKIPRFWQKMQRSFKKFTLFLFEHTKGTSGHLALRVFSSLTMVLMIHCFHTKIGYLLQLLCLCPNDIIIKNRKCLVKFSQTTDCNFKVANFEFSACGELKEGFTQWVGR